MQMLEGEGGDVVGQLMLRENLRWNFFSIMLILYHSNDHTL